MKATYLTHMGDDLMVANAARTSLGKHHTEFTEADAKLIRYLARHKHNNPFFHPQIQLHIKAPIFVVRQWRTHQVGFARSEVSRRYVDSEPEFYMPEVWRERAEGVKQGSKDAGVENQGAAEIAAAWVSIEAKQNYQNLLALGVAPEQARMVLPQSMYTEWVETGSLYAYAHLCGLRLAADAQDETRQLAQQVAAIIEPLFPESWAALMEAIV